MTERPKLTQKERREQRLQAACGKNLKRRKAQAAAAPKSTPSRPNLTIPPELPPTSRTGRPAARRTLARGTHGPHSHCRRRPLHGSIPISGAKNATLR